MTTTPTFTKEITRTVDGQRQCCTVCLKACTTYHTEVFSFSSGDVRRFHTCDAHPVPQPLVPVIREAEADLLDLVGKPVIVSTDSMAFNGLLKSIETGDATLLVVADVQGRWTRRIALSAVTRVIESRNPATLARIERMGRGRLVAS